MAEPKWSGLLTNASPYAIPNGAAVEQTNLHTRVPGQLESRSGMTLVAAGDEELLEAREAFPVYCVGEVRLLTITNDGEIQLSVPPAVVAEDPAAEEPDHVASSSTFTNEVYDGDNARVL